MDTLASPHPTEQLLSGYVLGTLDAGSAGAVHAHVEECARCRERIEAFSGAGLPAPGREVRPDGRLTSTPGQPLATTTYHGPIPSGPPGADSLASGLEEHPDYEIRRELGRGGMGVVYLARNRLMNRDEVLKVMGRHLVDNPALFERFLREIRAVARLRHENIVIAYSATRFGESIAFAMEYVEGFDLSRMVRGKGPLPVAIACNFAYQAALGLQHAHEEGLVHRDIKPGNLMLTRKGSKATIKVLDFGLAKLARAGSAAESLTHDGQVLGTPDFIAPEQITGSQSVDIRADIYGLGATLYYLLTGRPPFKASSIHVMFQAHLSREPDPLNLVRPEVPPELCAVVARMMAKDPAERFQTPLAAARALKPFFQGGGAAFKGPNDGFSSNGKPDESRPLRTPTAKAATEERAAGPGTPADRAIRSTLPEVRWESLIDFREADDPEEGSPEPSGPTFASVWFWPSIAVGVLIVGMVAGLLLMGLRVKTDKGELVFDGLPDDAVVTVDGKVVEVDWPGSDGPARISVAAGEHSVRVERRGVEVAGDDLKIKAGDQKWIRVRFVPVVADRPGKLPGPTPEGETSKITRPGTELAATPAEPPAASSTSPVPPRDRPPAGSSLPDVLYVDTFDRPGSGWPQEDPNAARRDGDSYHYGYANGVWFNSGSGLAEWSQPCSYIVESEFQLKVVGRILDATPESRGRWTIHIRPTDPKRRGFQIAVESNGVLALEPSFWDRTPLPGDPRIGPLVLHGFRTGTEFNTIVLRVRKRQVQILCNGIPACPPVSYDWDLTPSLIHLGVDGYKGSYRAEFDQIEIKKEVTEPAGPTANPDSLQPGATPAPATPAPRAPNLLFLDEFDDSRTGWGADAQEKPGAGPDGHSYRDGAFVIAQSMPGEWSYASAREFGGDFQVEVSGRVADASPDSSGFWAIHLIPRAPGRRGFQVGINRTGLLVLEPTFWHRKDAAGDPRSGPIPIRNFRRGNRFNTLTLRVRRRQVEVLVNSARVGPIISFDWDLTPATLLLGLNITAGSSRAEFERIEVKELPPAPAAAPVR